MMQQQAAAAATTNSLPSSSERSSSSATATHRFEIKQGMESDEDIHRVPEFGGGGVMTTTKSQSLNQIQRKRGGRTPADKEHKRLKRLLRNRVSAQQARERKKAHLTDLEAKVKGLEATNSHLEEKFSTLQNENHMLRQILKNTTGRGSTTNADGDD